MKIDLSRDRLAMWIVCEAISEETDIKKFAHSHEHDIILSVDGVELNFEKVINRIDELLNEKMDERAGKLLLERFEKRADDINDELERIRTCLKELRFTKFPDIEWDW